jgi:two-component system, chemotaxis family, chemotaxis protein CheY
VNNPADLNVIIVAKDGGVGRTVRMALRGMGLRSIQITADLPQTLDLFTSIEPHVLVVYVEAPENDSGIDLMRFIRRSPDSPSTRMPIVACSPRRDLTTVNAVINAGGHEYVLFPVSGDALLKKIIAARQASRAFIEQSDYVGPDRRRRDDKTYRGPERRAGQAKPAANGQ